MLLGQSQHLTLLVLQSYTSDYYLLEDCTLVQLSGDKETCQGAHNVSVQHRSHGFLR